VNLAGLKIESAPCESRTSFFQEVGYNSNLEAERATTGFSALHQEIVLRKNFGLPQMSLNVRMIDQRGFR
jgi:hypothetical protein